MYCHVHDNVNTFKGMNRPVTTAKNHKIDRQWVIVTLASIPLIMTLGNSMLIPILPLMEKELDITKLQSSYIITIYSIVAIFLIPVAGFLSDRYGRKKVIIPALIITAIGGAVAALAAWKFENAFLFILLGRVLQGIGASGAMPIVFPLIGDMFEREAEASKTLGLIETSNTIGKVLSPILGSLLASFLWFLPFVSIPIFSSISIILVLIFIKDHGNKDDEPFSFAMFRSYIKETFKEHYRWLIAIFIIGAILMFMLFGFLFYLSTVLEEKFSYTGVIKGMLLAVPLLALSLTAYIVGRVIKDQLIVMKWIIFSGIVLAGIAIISFPLAKRPFFLLAIFFVCGIGIGAALPCLDSMITKSLKKSVRGSIVSIYSAMRFVGIAAGPLVTAFLMKQHIFWFVGLLTIFALGASVLAFRHIDPE